MLTITILITCMQQNVCLIFYCFYTSLVEKWSSLSWGLAWMFVHLSNWLQLVTRQLSFQRFNSLTKQFSIIGNTHMLRGGVSKSTDNNFACEVFNLQKYFHPLNLRSQYSHFAFLWWNVWVAIHIYSALDRQTKSYY